MGYEEWGLQWHYGRLREMGRGQELVQAPRMIKHPLYETMDCYKRMGSCCRRKGRFRDSVSHTEMGLNDFSLQEESGSHSSPSGEPTSGLQLGLRIN